MLISVMAVLHYHSTSHVASSFSTALPAFVEPFKEEGVTNQELSLKKKIS